MPRVVCWQTDCVYWRGGRCRAEEIELDPGEGCLTAELQATSDDSEEEQLERDGMHEIEEA